jgi:hypothetical protein
MGMDEELKALIREHLDLQRRSIELLEASIDIRKRTMGWRLWAPILTLAGFLVILFLMHLHFGV